MLYCSSSLRQTCEVIYLEESYMVSTLSITDWLLMLLLHMVTDSIRQRKRHSSQSNSCAVVHSSTFTLTYSITAVHLNYKWNSKRTLLKTAFHTSNLKHFRQSGGGWEKIEWKTLCVHGCIHDRKLHWIQPKHDKISHANILAFRNLLEIITNTVIFFKGLWLVWNRKTCWII